jgi:type II secretory pathway pseudopilin PulG
MSDTPLSASVPNRGPHSAPTLLQRAQERISYARDAQHADDGFTLIEAIVSFGIFAIVTAAAVLAIVTGITSSNSTRDRVTAANVAQQDIAQIQTMPIASLATRTYSSPVGKESYTVTRTVAYSSATGACPATITAGTANTVSVMVKVTWPGNKGPQVEMDTVRAC